MTEKSILDNAIYVINFIIFCLVPALAQMRASLATMAEPKDSNSIEWKLRTFYWSCMNMGSYVKDAISVIRRTIITDLREYSLPFSSARASLQLTQCPDTFIYPSIKSLDCMHWIKYFLISSLVLFKSPLHTWTNKECILFTHTSPHFEYNEIIKK